MRWWEIRGHHFFHMYIKFATIFKIPSRIEVDKRSKRIEWMVTTLLRLSNWMTHRFWALGGRQHSSERHQCSFLNTTLQNNIAFRNKSGLHFMPFGVEVCKNDTRVGNTFHLAFLQVLDHHLWNFRGISLWSLFLKILFIFRERRRQVERDEEKHWCETDISQLTLVCTPIRGQKPTIQACALIGNWTSYLSFFRTAPNQLSHTGQGYEYFCSQCILFLIWFPVYHCTGKLTCSKTPCKWTS